MNTDGKPETGIQVPAAELESFAGRLRSCTKERSARSIARDAGVSETVFRKYAAGQSEPTRPALIGLARAAKVRLEWLATGDGPMMGAADGVAEGAQPPYDAAAAQALDPDRLADAIGMIESPPIARRGLTVESRARLVVLAYNALVNPDVGDNLRLFVAALTKLPAPPSNES